MESICQTEAVPLPPNWHQHFPPFLRQFVVGPVSCLDHYCRMTLFRNRQLIVAHLHNFQNGLKCNSALLVRKMKSRYELLLERLDAVRSTVLRINWSPPCLIPAILNSTNSKQKDSPEMPERSTQSGGFSRSGSDTFPTVEDNNKAGKRNGTVVGGGGGAGEGWN